MDVSGMNEYLNQVTQRIDDDMAFSSLDFLTPVEATFFTGPDRLHALRVDDRVARRRGFTVSFFDVTR